MRRVSFGLLAACTLCVGISWDLEAQPVEVESVESVESAERRLAEHDTEDDHRVDLLLELATLAQADDPENSLRWATEARRLSEVLAYRKGELQSTILLASHYDKASDYSTSFDFYLEALAIAEELGDTGAMSDGNRHLGTLAEYQGDNTEALAYYEEALRLARVLEDRSREATCLNDIGVFHRYRGDYSRALEFYFEAFAIAEELGDRAAISRYHNNSGIIHYFRGDYSSALQAYQKSLQIDRELGDRSGVGKSYNNIGVVYEAQGEYEKSLEYIRKGLKIREDLADKTGMANGYMNVGELERKLGDLPEALHDLENALALAREIDLQRVVAGCHIQLGRVHLGLGDFVVARDHGTKGYSLAKDLGQKEYVRNASDLLSEVHAALGDFEAAFRYQVEFKNESDALLNKESIERMSRLDYEYKLEREKQAARLEQEKAEALRIAESQRLRAVRDSLIVGYLLGAVVLLLLLRGFLQKRKANRLLSEQRLVIDESNRMLQESNATKDKFFSIIAHDLRSPFHALIGLSDLLLEKHTSVEDREREEIIGSLSASAKGAFLLVENLLEWSRAQAQSLSLCLESSEMEDLVGQALLDLRQVARNKHITIESEGVQGLSLRADREMLQTVLRNLLSNALKFTPRGGRVSIRAEDRGDEIAFCVEDTGVGMSVEKVSELFDVAKKSSSLGTDHEKGWGLGLPLCRDFVELHGGKIWVESEEGVGTTVWVTIPRREVPAASEDAQVSDDPGVSPTSEKEGVPAPRWDGQRVLLVEDDSVNQLVTRAHLARMGFEVTLASDGCQALERLEEQAFSLVLMDVRMPNMNGLEAAAEIRTREGEGEHVPIVALTASALPEERLRCLASGMDDCLSKPLAEDELVTTFRKWL